MTRPQQRLLAQLASSPNELASGLGQCLEALRLIAALPRTTPVFVHYTSASSPTIKAFGREYFSRVPLRTVTTLIKASLALSDPVRIVTALFYREDGTIDPTPVGVDEDSWKELAPYVHTLHVEDDLERPSTARSALSPLSRSPVVENGTMSSAGGSRGGLNSNAMTFVPSASSITIKTSDGARLGLQSLRRKPSFSPSSPQATSPFAILDNTGTCLEQERK